MNSYRREGLKFVVLFFRRTHFDDISSLPFEVLMKQLAEAPQAVTENLNKNGVRVNPHEPWENDDSHYKLCG